MENNFGNVFGGYTSIPWTSHRGFVSDPDSFLFLIRSKSVDNLPKICRIADPFGRLAVMHHQRYGPTFGTGHAIRISDKCDQFQVDRNEMNHLVLEELLINWTFLILIMEEVRKWMVIIKMNYVKGMMLIEDLIDICFKCQNMRCS